MIKSRNMMYLRALVVRILFQYSFAFAVCQVALSETNLQNIESCLFSQFICEIFMLLMKVISCCLI